MSNEKAIELLKNDCCYECSWGCRNPIECNNKECDYRQAIITAIESLEQDQEESLVIKKVKGWSHWKSIVTGKHLEDYKAVIFDKARDQIYVISDVITLHSEPNIELEPYERKE